MEDSGAASTAANHSPVPAKADDVAMNSVPPPQPLCSTPILSKTLPSLDRVILSSGGIMMKMEKDTDTSSVRRLAASSGATDSTSQKRPADEITISSDDDGDVTKKQKTDDAAAAALVESIPGIDDDNPGEVTSAPNDIATSLDYSVIDQLTAKRKCDEITTQIELGPGGDDGGVIKKQKTDNGMEVPEEDEEEEEPEVTILDDPISRSLNQKMPSAVLPPVSVVEQLKASLATPPGPKRQKVEPMSSLASKSMLQQQMKLTQANKISPDQNNQKKKIKKKFYMPKTFEAANYFYNPEQTGDTGPYRVRYQNCQEDGCAATFASHEFLVRHLIHTHNTWSYKCLLPGCHEAFATRPGLYNHTTIKHRRISQWPCRKCAGVNFNSHYLLFQHVFNYHYEGLFACVACAFTGRNRGVVTDHHRQTHRGLKRKDPPGMMHYHQAQAQQPPFLQYAQPQSQQRLPYQYAPPQQNSYQQNAQQKNPYWNSGSDYYQPYNWDSYIEPYVPETPNNGNAVPVNKKRKIEPSSPYVPQGTTPRSLYDPHHADHDYRASSSSPPAMSMPHYDRVYGSQHGYSAVEQHGVKRKEYDGPIWQTQGTWPGSGGYTGYNSANTYMQQIPQPPPPPPPAMGTSTQTYAGYSQMQPTQPTATAPSSTQPQTSAPTATQQYSYYGAGPYYGYDYSQYPGSY